MKTITKVINSFWFGAALYGAIGLVLWVTGNRWWAGVVLGAAGCQFIHSVKAIRK